MREGAKQHEREEDSSDRLEEASVDDLCERRTRQRPAKPSDNCGMEEQEKWPGLMGQRHHRDQQDIYEEDEQAAEDERPNAERRRPIFNGEGDIPPLVLKVFERNHRHGEEKRQTKKMRRWWQIRLLQIEANQRWQVVCQGNQEQGGQFSSPDHERRAGVEPTEQWQEPGEAEDERVAGQPQRQEQRQQQDGPTIARGYREGERPRGQRTVGFIDGIDMSVHIGVDAVHEVHRAAADHRAKRERLNVGMAAGEDHACLERKEGDEGHIGTIQSETLRYHGERSHRH